jgi:hypothetical protein
MWTSSPCTSGFSDSDVETNAQSSPEPSSAAAAAAAVGPTPARLCCYGCGGRRRRGRVRRWELVSKRWGCNEQFGRQLVYRSDDRGGANEQMGT